MKTKDRVGEKYINSQGLYMTIVSCSGCANYSVVFDKCGTFMENLQFSNIKRGHVKNPIHKSLYRVGFMGIGKYSQGKTPEIYKKWRSMIQRCYSANYHKTRSTYLNCSVCNEWHNFQVFAKWFEENNIEGFALDKDILVKGNKIYSPETCCFVPLEINSLFTKNNLKRGELPIGVTKNYDGFQVECNVKGNKKYLGTFKTYSIAFNAYKTSKETEIKRIANFWKTKISPQCYEAMINYKVELTD